MRDSVYRFVFSGEFEDVRIRCDRDTTAISGDTKEISEDATDTRQSQLICAGYELRHVGTERRCGGEVYMMLKERV